METNEFPVGPASVCPACGAPVDEGGACSACLSATPAGGPPGAFSFAPVAEPPEYGVPVRCIACSECGARFAVGVDHGTESDGRSSAKSTALSRCPLCGATALAPAEFHGASPVAAAPFTVPPARATVSYHRWLRRLWLCPTRWIALARSRGVRGLYLPLWKIETTIRSRWTAEIARGPVPADAGTDAEPLRWEPMAGERVDHETLRCAALELDPDSTIRTSLRDGAGLVSWAPEYLSGWIAVVPAGSPRDAWQEERDGLLERSRERCAAELPVDRYRALQVETSVELAEVSSALAPVYVAAVPWRGKVYRFVVDGRTGRAGGHAPFSRGKLGALIGAGVLAVAAMGAALAHEEPPNRPVAAEPTRAR